MVDPLIDDLNPEQRRAVMFGDGPLMLLAGAGSGKTRVITRRVARLLRDGEAAHRVLAVTFTNKAAGEMARRIEELGGERVLVSTFHSACARFLRFDGERLGYPRDFSIYDTYDRDSVIKLLMEEHKLGKDGVKPSQVGRRISHLKNLGVRRDELVVGHSPVDRIVERLWTPYQQMLMKLGALDFDDLIQRFLDLLVEHPDVAERYQERFRHILVDEFQDTNRVQYELLKRMIGGTRNITVVGDPDQSIYRFRGAELRNILDFQQDFPGTTVVRLEQNYRSTQTILRAAEAVIENNEERLEKRLRTDNEVGEALQSFRAPGPAQEARAIAERIEGLVGSGVDPAEIAIFYRSHYLSRGLEEALRARALPYQVIGGVSFFERKEIKDLLAYMRVVVNPLDDVSMERVINVPARGIGRVTLDRLRALATAGGMSLAEAIADDDARAGLSPKLRKSLAGLADAIDATRQVAERGAHDAMRTITTAVGYLDHLDSGDPEDQARIENLAELHNDAANFDREVGGGLAGYLQHVGLMTSQDRGAAGDAPRASLMTVHAAKGLEFDHVLVAGLEEGLFPSARSIEEPNGLEEERRLMYVALTRARKSVCLSWSEQRMVNGKLQWQSPSSFLRELPDDCLGEPRAEDRGMHRGDDDDWRQDPEPWDASQESQEAQHLDRGMRVQHPTYGAGTVLRTAGQGSLAKATVAFDASGERTLILEYAGLRILRGESAW